MLQRDCAEMVIDCKKLMLIAAWFKIVDWNDVCNAGLFHQLLWYCSWYKRFKKKTIEMRSDCLLWQTLKTNTKLVERSLMKLAVFGKLVSGRLLEDC